MSIDLQRVTQAISATREGLAAAGFSIDVDERGGRLRFAVKAGPEACGECLVPRVIFEDILGRELADGGIEADGFELQYPLDDE
ncbi:MAG: hypothetical protein QM750_29740 [Rubrivivax sp.]